MNPIPMILFCPVCHTQHIDAPNPATGWDNRPHRKHLCLGCGYLWTPCLLDTVGVQNLHTPPNSYRYEVKVWRHDIPEAWYGQGGVRLEDLEGTVKQLLPEGSKRLARTVLQCMTREKWLTAPNGDDWMDLNLPFVCLLRITRRKA